MTPKRALAMADLAQYQKEVALLQRALDLVSDHIIVTDSDAHILYANKAAEEATGYSFSEMLGKNPADLWGGNMPKEEWEKAWHTMKKEKRPVVLDVRNTRKDGAEVWQSLHISPVPDACGHVRLFIGIESNVTDMKQKEQFRENILSILGHKALGPLTGIHWFVELLCERGTLPDEDKEYLRELYGESRTLTALLSDFLFLSRMGKGHPVKERVDLSHLLAEVLNAACSRGACRFSYTKPEPLFLRTDPSLVRAFFQSLCEDMERETSSGRDIHVSLQKGKRSSVLSLTRASPPVRGMTDAHRPLALALLIARHLQWTVRQHPSGIFVTIPAPSPA